MIQIQLHWSQEPIHAGNNLHQKVKDEGHYCLTRSSWKLFNSAHSWSCFCPFLDACQVALKPVWHRCSAVWYSVMNHWVQVVIVRLLDWLPSVSLTCNDSEQLVYTQSSIVEEWRSAAEKVTVGLVSHRPGIIDTVVYPTIGSKPNIPCTPHSSMGRLPIHVLQDFKCKWKSVVSHVRKCKRSA